MDVGNRPANIAGARRLVELGPVLREEIGPSFLIVSQSMNAPNRRTKLALRPLERPDPPRTRNTTATNQVPVEFSANHGEGGESRSCQGQLGGPVDVELQELALGPDVVPVVNQHTSLARGWIIRDGSRDPELFMRSRPVVSRWLFSTTPCRFVRFLRFTRDVIRARDRR